MGWKVSGVMDERRLFIEDWLSGQWSVVALAKAYGISRKTANKVIARFKAEGNPGLADRSRAPKAHPNAVDPQTVARIVACKRAHLVYGPLKVLECLRREQPDAPWPAASTVGQILTRHGLVQRRVARARATPSAQPFAPKDAANEVWCADFKGWFYTGDGTCITPLTISDGHSRMLLCCQGLVGRTGFEQVKPFFELAFRRYGLPRVIHTDNGPPFSSVGLAGLSMLSVWWMTLGIVPERSRPGKPQDNGRHERMHRTLKQATAHPPANSAREQQRAFDRFLEEYNFYRPHQALGQQVPAAFYEASPRPFPKRLLFEAAYPDEWAVRKVKTRGRIKWRGQALYLASPLTGQHVGLEPIEDGLWRVHFINTPLCLLDERRRCIKPLPKPKKSPEKEE